MNLQDAEQIISGLQQIKGLRSDLNVVISYLNQDKGLDLFVKNLELQEKKVEQPAQITEENSEEEGIDETEDFIDENQEQTQTQNSSPIQDDMSDAKTIEEVGEPNQTKPFLSNPAPQPTPPKRIGRPPSIPTTMPPPNPNLSMAKQLELRMMKTRAVPAKKEFQI